MATLRQKILAYINGAVEVDFRKDVLIENRFQGHFIHEWNIDSIAKPTDAQLDALTDKADDIDYNEKQLVKRKAEYGTLEQQMENVMENGVTAEKNRVQAIKDKYPKK